METNKSVNTAEIWNQRYQNSGRNLSLPRDFLIENQDLLPNSGLALDVAMGLGHNANLMSEHGLKVIGVDFSYVALRKAKIVFPQLQVLLSNLPAIHFSEESFDVIVNFWFLDRLLFPVFRSILKSGGILILETMRSEPENEILNINPRYLLQPGELREYFSEWDFLIHDETRSTIAHGSNQPITRLIARKPRR
jgi:ubiquinone/menaquinone biosynthesis C-methylase UbiE